MMSYFAIATLHQTSHLTFGRDTAQFKQLVAFLAAVSIILWGIVFFTIIIRFVLCHVWYRHRYATVRDNLPPI